MTTSTLPLEARISPIRDVDISSVEPEYRTYINYAGERIAHSCDRMMSGYEAGFCDDELYFLVSAESDYSGHMGYSYSCGRHLRALIFEFALKIEDKRLDHEFDLWEDELAALEHAAQEAIDLEGSSL